MSHQLVIVLVLVVLGTVDAGSRRQSKPIKMNATETVTPKKTTVGTSQRTTVGISTKTTTLNTALKSTIIIARTTPFTTTTTTTVPPTTTDITTQTPSLESRTGEEQDEYLLYPKADSSQEHTPHLKEEHDETNVLEPTKYHYYPHNQHLYFLPECATQQVCSAVYLRLNYTQPLCACPERHKDPCSVSTNTNDRHTLELITDLHEKPLTIIKTCELVQDVRECRTPRDWSILALQNVRTGKSHYLVICRCPRSGFLDGPMVHNQPIYARVPGIRVYGMVCRKSNYNAGRRRRYIEPNPSFPWHKLQRLIESARI